MKSERKSDEKAKNDFQLKEKEIILLKAFFSKKEIKRDTIEKWKIRVKVE